MKNCFRITPKQTSLREKVENVQCSFLNCEGKKGEEGKHKLEFRKRIEPTKIKVKTKIWKSIENTQNFKQIVFGREKMFNKAQKKIQILKNQIKSTLMRMTYRQKLEHIQALLQQAHFLSQKYGYFFITRAMIIFDSEKNRKLSIWIHPDLSKEETMHPIQSTFFLSAQRNFYLAFKKVVSQLFPTISLGNGCSYCSLISNIKNLKSTLEKRLQKSSSTKSFSSLKHSEQTHVESAHEKWEQEGMKKVVKISLLDDFFDTNAIEEEDEQSSMEAARMKKSQSEKLYSPLSTIQSKENEIYRSFSKTLQEEMEEILSEKNFTLYDEQSSNTSRNEMLKKVEEEFNDILSF